MNRLVLAGGSLAVLTAAVGLAYAFAGDPLPAGTQTTSAGSEAGRYTMHQTDKGFVRLDTQSGEVSTCMADGDTMVCRLAADDRAAYEAEIEALAAENTHLRAYLAPDAERLGIDPGAPLAGEPEARRLSDDLPSTAEIDEAVGLVEYVVKRLASAARTISDEIDGEEPTQAN